MSSIQAHKFKVTMTCEGCSGAINRILGKLKEKGSINEYNVSLSEGTVVIKSSSMTVDEMLQTLTKSGKASSYVGPEV